MEQHPAAPRVELNVWQRGEHAFEDRRVAAEIFNRAGLVINPIPRDAPFLAEVGQCVMDDLIWSS
jgi:hypothetical protein